MPIRLEFIGFHVVRKDPMKFLTMLREKFPNVSEKGIHAIAAEEFEKRHPRTPRLVVHLFGRDILSDDVTTMAAWPLVDEKERRWLLQWPLAQRETKLDPPGLSRTYVWRKSAGWVQEVTDADADVLRRSTAAPWFRDVDKHGLWTPTRAWDFPVKERFEAPTIADGKAFVRDQTRRKTWNGV